MPCMWKSKIETIISIQACITAILNMLSSPCTHRGTDNHGHFWLVRASFECGTLYFNLKSFGDGKNHLKLFSFSLFGYTAFFRMQMQLWRSYFNCPTWPFFQTNFLITAMMQDTTTFVIAYVYFCDNFVVCISDKVIVYVFVFIASYESLFTVFEMISFLFRDIIRPALGGVIK